jgi:hypothetical protein
MNRYSISQQIRAEAAAEAAAKAAAEATARIFFQMLPSQFELMEFRPSYKTELIEFWVKNGINKEMIDAEYKKWLKKRDIKS